MKVYRKAKHATQRVAVLEREDLRQMILAKVREEFGTDQVDFDCPDGITVYITTVREATMDGDGPDPKMSRGSY